jgi:2-amino-4-hydroxy-6-hydroxymethyldihydropteridine diphosphokinase
MSRSLVALGSNLGDRERTYRQAIEQLAASEGISIVALSGVHETKPIGGAAGQASFLNAAVLVETSLSPAALHARLQEIELQLGRERRQRWDARTLDLDVLLYDAQVIATPGLSVPHPRMAFRRFVLEPAAEVAPDMVHPTIGWSMAQLLEHLNSATSYVALLGVPGSGKTTLAARLAEACGGRLLAQTAWPQRDDSSGQPLERQIQFLDAFAGMLTGSDRPRPGELVISDFFLDQSLAYARAALDPRSWEAFEAHWKVIRQSVARPKLIIVLDECPSAVDSPDTSDVAHSLARIAALPGQVVVYVGRHDPKQQFEEASAAIAAMR